MEGCTHVSLSNYLVGQANVEQPSVKIELIRISAQN